MMANMFAIGLLLSISSEKRDIPVEKGWKDNSSKLELHNQSEQDIEQEFSDISMDNTFNHDSAEDIHVSR